MGVRYRGEFKGTPAEFADVVWGIALDLASLPQSVDTVYTYCLFVEPPVVVESDGVLKATIDLPAGTRRVRIKIFSPSKRLPKLSRLATPHAPKTQPLHPTTHHEGFVTAERSAGGRSALAVEAAAGAWPEVQKTWALFLEKLKQGSYLADLSVSAAAHESRAIHDHWAKGQSIQEIALKTAVSVSTVKRRLRAMGLTRRRKRL